MEAIKRATLGVGRAANRVLITSSLASGHSEAVVAMLVTGRAAMLLVDAHAAMLNIRRGVPRGTYVKIALRESNTV